VWPLTTSCTPRTGGSSTFPAPSHRSGRIAGASKIARDITLQKRLQQELAAAWDAAEQAKAAAEQGREAAEGGRPRQGQVPERAEP
jgi:hypothetical protein